MVAGCDSRRSYPVDAPLEVTELECEIATTCQAALATFMTKHASSRITALAPMLPRGLLVMHTERRVPYPRSDDARLLAFPCEGSGCREKASSFSESYPDATVWTALPADLPTEPALRLLVITGPPVNREWTQRERLPISVPRHRAERA